MELFYIDYWSSDVVDLMNEISNDEINCGHASIRSVHLNTIDHIISITFIYYNLLLEMRS